MTDEVDAKHRVRLEEAVKKAVLDLLAHEHVGWAGFTLALNDRLAVTVGQTKSAADCTRLDSVERHNISVKPGFSGRAARWVASYDGGGYTNVFAGATARDAIDLAVADASKAR